MDGSARMGGGKQRTVPTLEDLLPELSREEQLRAINPPFPRRKTKSNRPPPGPVPPPCPFMLEQQRLHDARIMYRASAALAHYNARHPGGEFDAVKPLMDAQVCFRGQTWMHFNFWARSRATNKIKRFFAEVHLKPTPIPEIIVEVCTIIEEPLSQYRRSCAFCPARSDILHPKGSRKFVCGNDKDRFEQRLTPCHCCCIMY